MRYLIEATVVAGQGPKATLDLLALMVSLPDPSTMGITSRTMYASLDGRTNFLIVEADDPSGILERFASMMPWVETKVTPVMLAEEAAPAIMAAAQRIQTSISG
jgi:hypothetical protein